MSLSFRILILLLVLPMPALHAQTIDNASNGQKRATAIRVADGAVRVDGRLDESVWQQAPAIADFTQKVIERSTFSTQFRMGFTLKPDLNLDVYAEPFAASGRYYDYGELLAPASLERITYGTSGTSVEVEPDGDWLVAAGSSTFTLKNRDFNVRSFQSNVVLRWEWRPGSTMYIVWQQNRDARETLGTRVGLGDVFRSVRAPGSNIFLVKTSFWLPVG